jgi:hypothetical protein
MPSTIIAPVTEQGSAARRYKPKKPRNRHHPTGQIRRGGGKRKRRRTKTERVTGTLTRQVRSRVRHPRRGGGRRAEDATHQSRETAVPPPSPRRRPAAAADGLRRRREVANRSPRDDAVTAARGAGRERRRAPPAVADDRFRPTAKVVVVVVVVTRASHSRRRRGGGVAGAEPDPAPRYADAQAERPALPPEPAVLRGGQCRRQRPFHTARGEYRRYGSRRRRTLKMLLMLRRMSRHGMI